MFSSKLVTVLKTLGKQELKNFERFLETSPGNKEDRLKLYAAIAPHAPKYEHPDLDKEKLYAKCYPGEKYDARKLHHKISDLYKQLDEYLIQLELHRQTLDKEFLKLKAYRSRNLDNYFFKTAEKIIDELHKQKNQDLHYYMNRFLVNYYSYIHKETDKQQLTVESLQQSMDSLDLFFASAKLKLACEMRNRERIYNNKYEIRFLEDVLKMVQTSPFTENPIFEIYPSFIDAFLPNSGIEVDYLRDLFVEHQVLFSSKERFDLFVFLLNRYNAAYRKVGVAARKSQFELYKMALDGGFLIQDNQLDYQIYFHIILVSINIQEFDWALGFAEEYRLRMPREFRKDFYNMSLAECYFEMARYEESMDHLIKVALIDTGFKLRVRALELRLNYEFENWELLDSQLNAFNMFLRRDNRMARPVVERNMNFIKVMRQLARQKRRAPFDRKQPDKESLMQALQETKPIISENWLTEKIEAL